MTTIDPREFRNALGGFPTGVTVITAYDDKNHEPVGMTANSFSSVSLDPPLVLWSVARNANSFDTFHKAARFAIHVLHSGQRSLSTLFATKDIDKFTDLPHSVGTGKVPLLNDYMARFECKTEHRHDGGDHIILVGRVTAFDRKDVEPLGFFQGRYAKIVVD
ncbi:MAG: flavin reductase family protein [Porticoccaceae bacterium]